MNLHVFAATETHEGHEWTNIETETATDLEKRHKKIP